IRIADGLLNLELLRSTCYCAQPSFFHASLPIDPQSAAATLAASTLYESWFTLNSCGLDCELLGCRALVTPATAAPPPLPLPLPPPPLLRPRLKKSPPPSFEILPARS